MSYKVLTTAAALALGSVAAIACSKDHAPTAPPKAARIVAVDGNGQAGFIDTPLPVALVVRVSDAENQAVPNAPIDWRITEGAADLLNARDGAPFTVTDPAGVAAVLVRPTTLGGIVVTASTPTVPGARATFNASVRRRPDVVIQIVPGFDCGEASGFEDPEGSRNTTVRVGAVVEWVYAPQAQVGTFPCMARLRSATVPAGGVTFDETMNAGDRFQFVPNVAGVWEYVDAMNGGTARLTAVAP
jgi:hypothetical protein